MKVQHKDKVTLVEVWTLRPGDTFEANGNMYLVTNLPHIFKARIDVVHTVELTCGQWEMWSRNAMVNKIEVTARET